MTAERTSRVTAPEQPMEAPVNRHAPPTTPAPTPLDPLNTPSALAQVDAIRASQVAAPPRPGRGFAASQAALVLGLQQSLGNQAVQRLLQRTGDPRPAASPPAGSPPAGSPPAGAPDLAARIRSAPGGMPLAAPTQRRLEQGLGADLSSVRVHTDPAADALARSVEATAFTTGPDIFFRAGSYRPSSPAGLHLLAHEAAHTVQQASGLVAGPPAGGVVQRDHHRSNPKRASVDYGKISSDAMEVVGADEDKQDVDYDDLVDGWTLPDDDTYGDKKLPYPWTRPGFDKNVKKAILMRDLNGNCPICGQPLVKGVKYTTQKGKTKIDTLDIDHYSPDWIVRFRKIQDYYNANKADNDTIRRSLVEAYNDYTKNASIPGAAGLLRLTHSPCNRSRPKS